MTPCALQPIPIRSVVLGGSRDILFEALGKDVQQPTGTMEADHEALGTHGNGAAGTAARREGQPEVAGRIAESHGSDTPPDSRSVPDLLDGQAADYLQEVSR